MGTCITSKEMSTNFQVSIHSPEYVYTPTHTCVHISGRQFSLKECQFLLYLKCFRILSEYGNKTQRKEQFLYWP